MSNIIEEIVETLNERKAEEIAVFTDDNRSYILANSLTGKHTLALVYHLKESFSIENMDASDEWGIVMIENVEIHIMIPEYRQKYSIDMLIKERIQQEQVVDGISGKIREKFKQFIKDRKKILKINFKKIEEIVFLDEQAVICILREDSYLREMKNLLSPIKRILVVEIVNMKNSFKFSNQPTIFLLTVKDKEKLQIKY